jgi:RimJ/RimL family protein N-acetyltransferase
MTVLETERLRLRPFEPSDAQGLYEVVSAREVAEGTATIPHPYEREWAGEYIASIENENELAITLRADGRLVGSIALVVEADHGRGELGYVVGVPYWGQGFATEAARALVAHAFDTLGLNRVFAFCFTRNPASARVLQKLGMTHEGTRRGHTLKWGEYLDSEAYGILRAEWPAGKVSSTPNYGTS